MTDHKDLPEFRELVEKYLSNSCTREELDLFFKLMDEERNKAELPVLFKRYWEKVHPEEEEKTIDWSSRFEAMFSDANYTAPVFEMKRRNYRKLIAWTSAAAILLALFFTYVEFRPGHHEQGMAANTAAPKKMNDVAPGKNIAVLTLSDGSTIILDSVKNGVLAEDGSAKVFKMANGQLSYKPGNDNSGKLVYNTISTPKGGQYEIVLADGTKVWLNAGSSLKFPPVFTGNQRGVSLTGEGYFEVAKDPSKPFVLSVRDMKIEVLGTHFNVNAYVDEKTIATTLLEGSVKVSGDAKKQASAFRVLKPGQQANFDKEGKIAVKDDADLDEAISWKNGKFYFNNADISVMMRQISRWYDLEVKYEGTVPERKFTGKIDRNVNVSKIITMLEYAKVHVRLEGNTIVVAP